MSKKKTAQASETLIGIVTPIQWDNDETLSEDELDGDCEDGDVGGQGRMRVVVGVWHAGSLVY